MVYPHLKLHILSDINGLAIWSGFPDITHITYGRRDLVSVPILPNFELIRTISKWIYGINFGAIHEKMLSESR